MTWHQYFGWVWKGFEVRLIVTGIFLLFCGCIYALFYLSGRKLR